MGSETMGLQGVGIQIRTVEAAEPVWAVNGLKQSKPTAETMRSPSLSRHCVPSQSQNQKAREVSGNTTRQHEEASAEGKRLKWCLQRHLIERGDPLLQRVEAVGGGCSSELSCQSL